VVGFSLAYTPYGTTAGLFILAMIFYLAARLVANAESAQWVLLIIVIVIAGVVVAPNFVCRGCAGPTTACKSNLKTIGTALEMYCTDNSGKYPEDLAKLTPNYLKTIPTCPSAGSDTYSLSFLSTSEPDAYTVFCSGANHVDVSVPPDFPMYTATQ